MGTVESISGWLRRRSAEPRRARSVVMTIFCDAIVPHGGRVALGSLVEAGGFLGISEQAVRTSVNRLIAEGWLCSEALGRRSIYRLSDSGLSRSLVPIQRVYQTPSDDWQGQWSILLINHWLVEHDVFYQATRDILWAGYGRLSDNVFIRPERDGDFLPYSTESVLDKKFIRVVGAHQNTLTSDTINDMAHRVWDLELIAAQYKEFQDQYAPLMIKLGKKPNMRSAEVFAIRAIMIHDLRRIRMADPQLPSSLQPAGWKGAAALDLGRRLYQVLLSQSEHYINEFVQGPEGAVPPADATFYARFGGLI